MSDKVAELRLATGISFALAAGLAWGLVFVTPVLLPDYSPAMLTFGRYLAFGMVALPLAWRDRGALSRLSKADWIEALKLAAVGNVLYYLALYPWSSRCVPTRRGTMWLGGAWPCPCC
jgi:drug/metabolite transporter (DMT)-like permease